MKLTQINQINPGDEKFPAQYVIKVKGMDSYFVVWTPLELNYEQEYNMEVGEIMKVPLNGNWIEASKTRLTYMKETAPKVESPTAAAETSSNKSTPVTSVTQVQDDSVYHKMAFEYLVRNNQLSLTTINELAPVFKSICNGTISKEDLGKLNLKYYGESIFE